MATPLRRLPRQPRPTILRPSNRRSISLRQYLADWDAAAVDHLEANRELVRARFSREAFAELEQRIKAFAFDEARAQLEEAMTSHAG